MTPGHKYLKVERGLTEATIRKFHLGYQDPKGIIYEDTACPDLKPMLTDYRLRDTALFPIFSVYGDLVGISGRVLVKEEGKPKYVNTPYEKASHCYGLDVTWREVLAQRKVYVVEGNVDLLMMYQHGIKNAVGMLGSNLSVKQVALLSGFADEIVMVPDGDVPGRQITEKIKRAIPKRYSKVGLTFSFVPLPDGFDPDKFLNEKGPEALKSLEKKLFSPDEPRRLNHVSK